jgi:hypothetical protein
MSTGSLSPSVVGRTWEDTLWRDFPKDLAHILSGADLQWSASELDTSDAAAAELAALATDVCGTEATAGSEASMDWFSDESLALLDQALSVPVPDVWSSPALRDQYYNSLSDDSEKERYKSALVQDPFAGPPAQHAEWLTDRFQSRCYREYTSRMAKPIKRRHTLRQAGNTDGSAAVKKSRAKKRSLRETIKQCSEYLKCQLIRRVSAAGCSKALVDAVQNVAAAHTASSLRTPPASAAVAAATARALLVESDVPDLLHLFDELMAKWTREGGGC